MHLHQGFSVFDMDHDRALSAVEQRMGIERGCLVSEKYCGLLIFPMS